MSLELAVYVRDLLLEMRARMLAYLDPGGREGRGAA
jgi:hypothetical protein